MAIVTEREVETTNHMITDTMLSREADRRGQCQDITGDHEVSLPQFAS